MQLDRLITLIMAGLMVIVVLAIGVGRLSFGESVDTASDSSAGITTQALATREFKLRPIDAFGTIHLNPLFRSDRKVPENDGTAGAEDATETASAAADSKLDVVLTGIVMSPTYRFALLKDNTSSKSVTLSVGDHFEGDLAAWKLNGIEAREVTFGDNKGATEAVALKVNTSSLGKTVARAKKRPRNKGKKDKSGIELKKKTDPKEQSEADEIRRKVASRRARMRAEAAKKKAKKNKSSKHGH